MPTEYRSVVVIGLGAIGQALLAQAQQRWPTARCYSVSRQAVARPHHYPVDYRDEQALAQVAATLGQQPIDLVLVTVGLLHTAHFSPEKSLGDLSLNQWQQTLETNTIIPALLAKHFLPYLAKDRPSVFAALSARVGSISDNRLGGWYSYRASKAALNMVIRTASIEMARRNPQAMVVGLHPGTVDSPLSKPFQRHVPPGKLFDPTLAAGQLLEVVGRLQPQHNGQCLGWDGQLIDP